MSTLTRLEETLAKMIDHFCQIGKMFRGYNESDGAGWDLAQLRGIFTAVRKLLPCAEGGRVRLLKAPACNGGWSRSKHFLIVGAIATVRSIEFVEGQFSANLVFDDETWIDHKGNKRLPDHKRHYRFALPDFETITETGGIIK